MRYLLTHTKEYLRGLDPAFDWNSLVAKAEFVIAHPNRWSEHEQNFLAQAALAAGLVTRETLDERLSFVEEGENSASFCLTAFPALAGMIKVLFSHSASRYPYVTAVGLEGWNSNRGV